jgi:hypothetical protein
MRHGAAHTLPPITEGRLVVVVVSVELSPVTGGLLRTWSDGGSQLWQVWGGDGLAEMMGRGQLARTEVEPDRYREVGLLEQPSDTTSEGTGRLLLPARWQPGREGAPREGAPMELEMAGEALHLSPVAEADMSAQASELWPGLVAHLSELCVESAERGEVLLIERGALAHEPWPYALFAVIRADDGSWISHLEASPAPEPETSGWEQAARGHNADGTEGASMSAPADFETVRGAGFLLAVAAAGWAATPQDLVITYTAAPSGPVELDEL